VYDDDVASAENCASCGNYLPAAASLITVHGLLCWQCQTRIENQMFLALFPALLAFMTWTLRSAYEPSRAESDATHIGRVR
jgi:hypothetical protein